MSYEDEPRYCVNCGQPLTNAAEMFTCWMCEEEEQQRLLDEKAEKDADETEETEEDLEEIEDDDLFDDELEDDEDY